MLTCHSVCINSVKTNNFSYFIFLGFVPQALELLLFLYRKPHFWFCLFDCSQEPFMRDRIPMASLEHPLEERFKDFTRIIFVFLHRIFQLDSRFSQSTVAVVCMHAAEELRSYLALTPGCFFCDSLTCFIPSYACQVHWIVLLGVVLLQRLESWVIRCIRARADLGFIDLFKSEFWYKHILSRFSLITLVQKDIWLRVALLFDSHFGWEFFARCCGRCLRFFLFFS